MPMMTPALLKQLRTPSARAARDAGYKAWHDEIERDANPHLLGSLEAAAWDLGWWDARCENS